MRLLIAIVAIAAGWIAGRGYERAQWQLACETPTPDDLPPTDTYVGALWERILHTEGNIS